LYGLERFSTDLDFDLLDTTKNVDKKLTEILKKYGQVKK
jgi:predicted nucleotidyltransferase component of viral defense system